MLPSSLTWLLAELRLPHVTPLLKTASSGFPQHEPAERVRQAPKMEAIVNIYNPIVEGRPFCHFCLLELSQNVYLLLKTRVLYKSINIRGWDQWGQSQRLPTYKRIYRKVHYENKAL